MPNTITPEAPLGRKARRQRDALQRIDQLTNEITALRARLEASEAALRERDSTALQESCTEQIGKLQSHTAQLEADLASRGLEVGRLESTVTFLKEELEEVRVQKEWLRVDYDRLAAELKVLKVARARNDIAAWRAVGHNSPWKRCYQRIEGLFRRERDDDPSLGFNDLLRLPPP